uniref:Keratin-associated protein 19-2-like n=1 Tax=Nicotiana tabacum TaxID=4097 RepID=A0A1S3YTJ9_TOBAC|nr:PREDICTED: keratin-associated protein 19-2-like [Nicotiana tabacum]
MASMQCYKEEAKDFDYYSHEKSSGTYQKPTNYSNTGYQQSYYEKERCYETNPGMTGYGTSHGHQHGLGNRYGSTNPCGPMMGHGSDHGKMGYGSGHNTHGMMGYGTGHNTHMQKPGFSGTGSGALGHVMGFGKKHEGHGGYGMGATSGCTTTYKKQHRRRKGGYGSGSDCSDSSDDERRC